MAKSDSVYGKFVAVNEQHLTDNLDFMVRYMEANKFFGTNSIIKQFPKTDITTAMNAFLDILQSGNIEQRRHDVVAALHGHIAITKLSFGVTTNALTAQFGKKETETPPPPPHT